MIQYIYSLIQEWYGFFNCKFLKLLNISIPPLVVRLRLTSNCNLNCSFCYLKGHLGKDSADELSLVEWEKVILALPRWVIVDITGGEPFLAKNFLEIIELVLRRKRKASITTNGFQVPDEYIEFIVKNGLYYLMVSLDGKKEIHNEVRGNKKAYESSINFIERVNHYKKRYKTKLPHICIKSTVLNHNSLDIVKINQTLAENLNISSHSLNLLFQNESRGGLGTVEDIHSTKFKQGNTAAYESKAIPEIFNNIKSLNTISSCPINIKPQTPDIKGYLKHPSNFGVKKCYRAYSILTLYNDGSITPCDISFKIADIKELKYKMSNAFCLPRFKSFTSELESKEYHAMCDGCCLSPHSIKK